MHPTRSIDLHPEALAYRIDMGRTLAVVVTIGLALVIRVSLAIHNGPSPTCASIPNPPQHDCFRPGPERREFSVDYLTPNGVRSLLWFQLPEP
jgi:hypothetical protein